MVDRGINVPPNESCIWQDYKDSTVEEYYLTERERNERVRQLAELGRAGMAYFAHITRQPGITEVYAVRWIEPRGVDDGVRTGS